MKTLGNYYHDFPKLAKQAGYFFHLYRGKVNWNELEDLNLDDITENRNFQLLEQNLVNVINCNLEREYDLKILDKNFVKLFKLAQLGIDYLSFCELYLDKCVILLQEKLIAFQEKCEFLRQENEKKNEELKKRKKKTSNSNYQCDKCEKFFISEFYLKGHDKRRHSNPATPNISARKYSAKKQHTDRDEDKLKKSTPILTATEKQNDSENYDVEEAKKLECDNLLKIKNLEKNLEELENRLKKAESTSLKTSQSSVHSFPCSQLLGMFYPQVLPKATPYFSRPEVCCSKQNQEPYLPDPFPSHLPPSGSTLNLTNIKTVIPETLQTDYSEFKINESQKTDERGIEKLKDEDFQIPKESFLDKCRITTALEIEDDSSSGNCPSATYPTNFKTLEINEKPTSPTSNSKALLLFQAKSHKNKISLHKFDNASTSNDSLGPDKEEWKKLMHHVDLKEINASNNFMADDVLKKLDCTLVKKKMEEKSIGRQNLSKSFKKSLSGLSNLVFSNGPNFNSREKEVENLKRIAEDKLNHQLRNLGVDPEWSSLPKKTMLQSFKSLEQQRKFLTKKNSMYPTVRKTLKKWIFKKLREEHENVEENEKQRNIEGTKSELKGYQATFDRSLGNLESSEKNIKPLQKLMYDIETESESELAVEDIYSNQDVL